jgi:hypothetical protein
VAKNLTWRIEKEKHPILVFIPIIRTKSSLACRAIEDWKRVGFRGSTSKPSCSFLLSEFLGRLHVGFTGWLVSGVLGKSRSSRNGNVQPLVVEVGVLYDAAVGQCLSETRN